VGNNLLDLSSFLQIGQASASKGTVDLQSVDENGDSDEAVGLDILVETVGDGLVKNDSVLGLVLYLSLGPLLNIKSAFVLLS